MDWSFPFVSLDSSQTGNGYNLSKQTCKQPQNHMIDWNRGRKKTIATISCTLLSQVYHSVKLTSIYFYELYVDLQIQTPRNTRTHFLSTGDNSYFDIKRSLKPLLAGRLWSPSLKHTRRFSLATLLPPAPPFVRTINRHKGS